MRASEASVEQLTGQSFLQGLVDSQAIARYGVPTRNVLNVVEAVGSEVRTVKVGDHVITCLQFSGNRIVSGSDDNTLKVSSVVLLK